MPDAAPTTPAPAPTPRSEGGPGERWVAGLLLVVLAAGFLALAAPRIAAPFGDSDEGINGAVWGLDSRALRERGPIDSALGGRRADGTTYASHPPLIVVTTATA